MTTSIKSLEAPSGAGPENGDIHQQRNGESEVPALTGDKLVPFTSLLIAATRALESRRSDRLINDCFAELLAGEEGMRALDEKFRRLMRFHEFEPGLLLAEEENDDTSKDEGSRPDHHHSNDGTGAASNRNGSETRQLAIRTRFCDDFFEDCTLQPRNIKQIVLLGAGMDTRGYRLRSGPGTTVFEVDQALVLAYKNKILSGSSAQSMILDQRVDGVGRAQVIGVEANFMLTGWEDDLIKAGFDPTLPSAWIMEGLTMYLEEHEVAKLVQAIASLSSPGSAFCVSIISAECLELAKSSVNEIFRTWKWGSDDPHAFFKGHLPDTWSLKCVKCGAPGEFPDGAGYSVRYDGKGHTLVIGYAALSSTAENMLNTGSAREERG